MIKFNITSIKYVSVSRYWNVCGLSWNPTPNQLSCRVSKLRFKAINQLSFVHFFFLGGFQVLIYMNVASKYFLAVIMDTLTLREAFSAFEQGWIIQFWALNSVQDNNAFQEQAFGLPISIYPFLQRMQLHVQNSCSILNL